jgi:hypothetical protein
MGPYCVLEPMSVEWLSARARTEFRLELQRASTLSGCVRFTPIAGGNKLRIVHVVLTPALDSKG